MTDRSNGSNNLQTSPHGEGYPPTPVVTINSSSDNTNNLSSFDVKKDSPNVHSKVEGSSKTFSVTNINEQDTEVLENTRNQQKDNIYNSKYINAGFEGDNMSDV